MVLKKKNIKTIVIFRFYTSKVAVGLIWKLPPSLGRILYQIMKLFSMVKVLVRKKKNYCFQFCAILVLFCFVLLLSFSLSCLTCANDLTFGRFFYVKRSYYNLVAFSRNESTHQPVNRPCFVNTKAKPGHFFSSLWLLSLCSTF